MMPTKKIKKQYLTTQAISKRRFNNFFIADSGSEKWPLKICFKWQTRAILRYL
jgi:hypothetical protein